DRAVPGLHDHAELGAGQDDDLGAACYQVGDRGPEPGAGGGQDGAAGQLAVQRVVQVVLVLALGDQDVQPVALAQPAREVGAGHGVPAAEQPGGGETGLLDLPRGRVDDMQQGQAGQLLDALAGGVDGVAGQQEEVRAGSLEMTRLGGEQVPDLIPAALALV